MNKLTILDPYDKKPIACNIYAFIEHTAGSEFLHTYDDDYAETKAVHEPVLEVMLYDSSKGIESGSCYPNDPDWHCCPDWETCNHTGCGHIRCGEVFSIYWTQSSGWGIGDFQRLLIEVSQINYNYSLNKIDYGAWEYPELTI